MALWRRVVAAPRPCCRAVSHSTGHRSAGEFERPGDELQSRFLSRILHLSWRSPGHPQRGGAEQVTHETLKRLVAAGHEVTLFSAMWPGAAEQEEIDGIRVLRAGAQWSVHLRAWRWARRHLDDFDYVVDEVNTIPFFTPGWVPEAKRRMFIHQTAREFWWKQTPGLFKLIAPIGYVAEPCYLRLYRRTRALAMSPSTKAELVELGFAPDAVTVIPQSITFTRDSELEPVGSPFRVIIVGRLEPAKHVEESISAFAELQRTHQDAALDIVGAGTPVYREALEAIVAERGLRNVTFHGRVDDARKLALMRAAHAHVFCSHREGWGLTVTEAAAVGTPTVGYAVPGVRDSIGDAAWLAPKGDAVRVGALLLTMADDPALYEEARRSAWRRTEGLSYDATASAFWDALVGAS